MTAELRDKKEGNEVRRAASRPRRGESKGPREERWGRVKHDSKCKRKERGSEEKKEEGRERGLDGKVIKKRKMPE